jgi:hypothetical protein
MDWALERYYPFLDACQYRVDRLKNYSVPMMEPEVLRSLGGKGATGHWLDGRPYQVLLAEGDRVVGIHYEDAAYVLIVRDGIVMAGVLVDELPNGVRDGGHCDYHVVNFERMLESDESLQANAFQQAFDYAGRIYDRSTKEGVAKSGALVTKLRPIHQYFERTARDRAVAEQMKRSR